LRTSGDFLYLHASSAKQEMHIITFHFQIEDSASIFRNQDTVSSRVITTKQLQNTRDSNLIDVQVTQSKSTVIPKSLVTAAVPDTTEPAISNFPAEISKRQEPVKVFNFLTENKLNETVEGYYTNKTQRVVTSSGSSLKPSEVKVNFKSATTYDWLFGIFLLLSFLFIWIKVFYGKFYTTLANALNSYQISAKLYHEKNILTQRVSILLDFIYLIVFSIFCFEIATFYHLWSKELTPIKLYLVFFNLVILYTLFRLFILKLTGYVFLAQGVISEYIHSTYVINKGLGIVLFHVTIMVHYFPDLLIPVVMILGGSIFFFGFIFKIIRAYQIIIRKDVLLFYLILYLCTLEILPLLLGFKFVKSLIQSH
jgi:hypothetical protein